MDPEEENGSDFKSDSRQLNCSDSEHMDPEEENGSDFKSDSRQITDLDKMMYFDVIKLMEYLKIESAESGPQDRKLLREYLYSKDWKGSHEDKMEETVNKAMNKYITGKTELHKIYIKIQDIGTTDPFKKKASQHMKQFQERMKQFETDDIQICIFGWTCTGKSTFFNILLGNDIMKTHCLPDTPCLVRLHSSQSRKIQVVDKHDSLKTVHLNSDPKDAKRKLEPILHQFSGSDTSLGAVDLYWPIPVHKNLVFVDVPGIGNSNLMTQTILNHVSNADGHIFIINSGDGGGILEGGIVQIFQRIKETRLTGGRTNENLGNVLCVLNKWDLVKVHDRETVLKYARERLNNDFVFLNDWQIIPFSASVELQLRQLNARPTNEFVKILEGLERLVSGTTEKRLFDLVGCINNTIQWSKVNMDEIISAKEKKIHELTTETTMKEDELKTAEEKIKTVPMAVERMINKYKSALITNLKEYLTSPDVRKEVFNWNEGTPAVKDLKNKGPVLVRERITMLVRKWALKADGLLQTAIENTKKECSKLAAENEEHIDSTKLNEQYYPLIDISWTPFVLATVGIVAIESAAILSGTVVIGVTFSALAATGFGLLVTPLGIFINAGIIYYSVHSKKKSEMARLTQEAMDEMSSDESTETLINTTFEGPFKKWIERFRDMMQVKINTIRESLDELKRDVQRERKNLHTWTKLRKKLLTCSENVTKIRKDYDLMQLRS